MKISDEGVKFIAARASVTVATVPVVVYVLAWVGCVVDEDQMAHGRRLVCVPDYVRVRYDAGEFHLVDAVAASGNVGAEHMEGGE